VGGVGSALQRTALGLSHLNRTQPVCFCSEEFASAATGCLQNQKVSLRTFPVEDEADDEEAEAEEAEAEEAEDEEAEDKEAEEASIRQVL